MFTGSLEWNAWLFTQFFLWHEDVLLSCYVRMSYITKVRSLSFPFPSSIITSSPAYGVLISQPMRYAQACSSYECFIMRTKRLSSKVLNKPPVTLEIIIQEVLWSIRGFYSALWSLRLTNVNNILALDQLQWLPTRSEFPPISWHWYRAWPSSNNECFPWSIFATGVSCQQGTLTLPTPGSVPPFYARPEKSAGGI